ncbi:hypothetical protein [Burkholderia sp. GS2Y]|uniref:Uncharacterized protein n=1 Tax=Burkholderia theae TaxID=3143496 RepID=A0ABU9WLB4_9BURK
MHVGIFVGIYAASSPECHALAKDMNSVGDQKFSIVSPFPTISYRTDGNHKRVTSKQIANRKHSTHTSTIKPPNPANPTLRSKQITD